VLKWFGAARPEDPADLIARRKYGRAIELLRARIERENRDHHLRLQLADALVLAGRPDEAVPLFIDLADEFARDGFAGKAIALLKKLEKIVPGRADVEARLARLIFGEAGVPRATSSVVDEPHLLEDRSAEAAPAVPAFAPTFEPVFEPEPQQDTAQEDDREPSEGGAERERDDVPAPGEGAVSFVPADPAEEEIEVELEADDATGDDEERSTTPGTADAPQPAQHRAASRPPRDGDDDGLALHEPGELVRGPVLDELLRALQNRPPLPPRGLGATLPRLPVPADAQTEAPSGRQRAATSPLFSDFEYEELLAVMRGMRLLTFEPGDVILTQGDPGRSMFVLTTGEVKAFIKEPSGLRTILVRRLGEGEFFGEISVLSGRPRTATVTAATRCELLELDAATLDAITAKHPRVRDVLEEFYVDRVSTQADAVRQGTRPGEASAAEASPND
jgi:hypothetical protein